MFIPDEAVFIPDEAVFIPDEAVFEPGEADSDAEAISYLPIAPEEAVPE